jgi:hypothetical protein
VKADHMFEQLVPMLLMEPEDLSAAVARLSDVDLLGLQEVCLELSRRQITICLLAMFERRARN